MNGVKPAAASQQSRPEGTAWEVLLVFLKLGMTSFGGPIAHLGYFRTEIVERRRWMSDQDYAELVALCQFLPGPASSQVGFGIGLHRAGTRGALAAFIGFTLPSAVVMIAFAYGALFFVGPVSEGLVTGLKVVAVAIIAQAVLGMAKTLTPDRQRAAIAAVAAVAALFFAGSVGQIAAIVLGALAGYLFCRTNAPESESSVHFPVRRSVGVVSLVLFTVLLLGGPLLTLVSGNEEIALFSGFYQSGALVFGGGHVVLPLLQAATVDTGWVSNQDFLAGYGAAQALPGPLFAFAGFLGALSTTGPGGLLGAGIALIAIFLPGFLLLTGVLPFWNTLRTRPWVQAVIRGVNAAVVGILAAALYSPVFTSSITTPGAFALAVVCFVLLVAWKLPPWFVVLVGASGGLLLTVTA